MLNCILALFEAELITESSIYWYDFGWTDINIFILSLESYAVKPYSEADIK